MAQHNRIGLSAFGKGKLFALGAAGLYVGLHVLGVSVGLIEPSHPVTTAVPAAEPPSLADRDAEVRRAIAAREAEARAIRSREGSGY